jgi:hypothetical protein
MKRDPGDVVTIRTPLSLLAFPELPLSVPLFPVALAA